MGRLLGFGAFWLVLALPGLLAWRLRQWLNAPTQPSAANVPANAGTREQ